MGYTKLNINDELMEYIGYEELFPCGCWYNDISNYIEKTVPLHWHDSFEVLILKKGHLDYCVDGIHYDMTVGDGLFINSNAMHTATQIGEERAETFEITFRSELIGNGKESLIYKKYVIPVIKSGIGSFELKKAGKSGIAVLELLEQVYKLDRGEFLYEFDCLTYLLGIWRELMSLVPLKQNLSGYKEKEQKHGEDMRRIISFIYENYQEKIVVDDLIRVANISRSECFRSFLAYTMKNPMEFINDYRLLRAAGFLKDTDWTITEISQRCGFSSSSYFTLQFKRKYGLTPRVYRMHLNRDCE